MRDPFAHNPVEWLRGESRANRCGERARRADAEPEAGAGECADEALLVTPHGRVLECPTSSFFLVRDGEVLTAPLEDHVLDSITRRVVLAVAAEYQLTRVGLGFAIFNAQQLLDVERLYAALVAVSLLGFSLATIVDWVEDAALPWRAHRRT